MTTNKTYDASQYPPFAVTSDLCIFTIRDGLLQVLLVERGEDPYQGFWALPGGFLGEDESSEEAAARELMEETGLDLSSLNEQREERARIHLEQVRTYSEPERDPRMRVVSVAYLAIAANLPAPVAGDDAAQARWWPVKDVLGEDRDIALAFDHERILGDAVERVRAKLEYTTLATQFVTEPFTLRDLQRVYVAVWGVEPYFPNFRRKVLQVEGFVEPEGTTAKGQAGTPAKMYRAGGAWEVYPPMTRNTQES